MRASRQREDRNCTTVRYSVECGHALDFNINKKQQDVASFGENLMGKIAEFERLLDAENVIKESVQIGNQATSLITQVIQMVRKFLVLRAMAEDSEDEAVFDRRYQATIALAKQQMAGATPEEKQFVQSFVEAILA